MSRPLFQLIKLTTVAKAALKSIPHARKQDADIFMVRRTELVGCELKLQESRKNERGDGNVSPKRMRCLWRADCIVQTVFTHDRANPVPRGKHRARVEECVQDLLYDKL